MIVGAAAGAAAQGLAGGRPLASLAGAVQCNAMRATTNTV